MGVAPNAKLKLEAGFLAASLSSAPALLAAPNPNPTGFPRLPDPPPGDFLNPPNPPKDPGVLGVPNGLLPGEVDDEVANGFEVSFFGVPGDATEVFLFPNSMVDCPKGFVDAGVSLAGELEEAPRLK